MMVEGENVEEEVIDNAKDGIIKHYFKDTQKLILKMG